MMNKIKTYFERVCEDKKEAILSQWENPYQGESWEEYADRMFVRK